MEQYEIYTKGREKPFIFVGKYRRDLETDNWHYYEDQYGILFHFRKEHIVAVFGDTAKSVLANRNKQNKQYNKSPGKNNSPGLKN